MLRTSEGFLDVLGAHRVPDPTTAADFCRRFAPVHIDAVQSVSNEARLKVWQRQPEAFFDQAIIEADGSSCRRRR